MKIFKFAFTVFLITVASLFCTSFEQVEAKSVENLKENKTYSYNLDKKGKKEKISFSMNNNGTYKIEINGKVKKKIKLGQYFYNPCMQICDIDKKDGKMDIWVYAYADSHDIRYSALYQYSKGKIKKVGELEWVEYDGYSINCGFLVSTNGKGEFTVAIDRAVDVGYLTGNHFDQVKFKLENGKIKKVSEKTFSFYKTYTSGSGKWLKTSKKMKFYKSHSKSSGTVTIKKGAKCVPKKIYIESENQVYVMYKFSDGKKLWLCSDDYEYENQPFKNMAFFD